MPLLRVVGGPIATSGKTLTAFTTLSILYEYAYADVSQIYPIRYDASYDISWNQWKPLGAPNTTHFYIPGPVGNKRFPKVTIHEMHVYSDGTSQSFYRRGVIIVPETGNTWNYAQIPEPVVITNSVVVAWVRLQVPLGAEYAAS